MTENALLTKLRSVYRRFAGPEATLSEIPLAGLRFVFGNRFRTRANGLPFVVDLRDTIVSFDILTSGKYEPAESRLLESLVKPGDFVVDIGAHIGYYSILFCARVGPSGRVLSLEPDRENAALLRHNIALNHFESVIEVVEAAAGASEGSAVLYRAASGNRGDNRLYESHDDAIYNPGRVRERTVVRVATVDQCTRSWDKIDLVKMDVEGYEPEVLKGMRGTLDRNQSIVVVTEFWPYGIEKAGGDPVDLLSRLSAHGFALWEIRDEGRIAPLGREDMLRRLAVDRGHTNLVCARPEFSARRLTDSCQLR